MTEKLKIIGAAILEGYGNKFFSLDQLIEVTGISRSEILETLARMKRQGLILEIRKTPIKTNEQGRPQVSLLCCLKNKKKFKERVAPKLRNDTAQDRMWKIIRATQPFRINDLIVLAGVTYENARWFIKQLRRAGYIQSSGKSTKVTWKLINDPGPKRPYTGSLKQKEKPL